MSDAAAKREAAAERLVALAGEYAFRPNPETWRELCRAKATLDAHSRVWSTR
jgi:hypothetical protein